nr:PREDICTED: ceramide synthase 2 [Struthio camelus australis]
MGAFACKTAFALLSAALGLLHSPLTACSSGCGCFGVFSVAVGPAMYPGFSREVGRNREKVSQALTSPVTWSLRVQSTRPVRCCPPGSKRQCGNCCCTALICGLVYLNQDCSRAGTLPPLLPCETFPPPRAAVSPLSPWGHDAPRLALLPMWRSSVPRTRSRVFRPTGAFAGRVSLSQTRGQAPLSMFQTLYSYFWWERLWLPANLTWADLEDRDGRVYAKASDLYITLPLAFLFLVIRHLFETYVATPLAGLLNVKEKIRLKATPNAVLEKFYVATTKHPKQAAGTDVEMLSKKSGCTVRQVERWFRRRRNQDRPSLLKKFREASWRFTFYLIAFIAGMAVIVDKPWFYDLREVWKGYPIQSMLPSQYWYYMIELSFYWSLLFSIASDVKRKDFKEQIIHHVATIILISFSWFANYIRAGTLIMALHDSSDYLLESAKMFNYAGWRNTCNNIFIVFAAVFIITRLVILPFWIMHCTVVYPLDLYPAFFGYYFFNFMMVVLQSLHIFWAYLIIRMAQKFITGKVVEDERSDREETDDTEEEEEVVAAKNGPLSNGHPILNNNHRKTD